MCACVTSRMATNSWLVQRSCRARRSGLCNSNCQRQSKLLWTPGPRKRDWSRSNACFGVAPQSRRGHSAQRSAVRPLGPRRFRLSSLLERAEGTPYVSEHLLPESRTGLLVAGFASSYALLAYKSASAARIARRKRAGASIWLLEALHSPKADLRESSKKHAVMRS